MEYAPFKLDINDKIVQEVGLFYLPYSVGMEIETSLEKPSQEVFELAYSIPYTINTDVNHSIEQRFRIPAGVKGLVSLFYISEFLNNHAYLNISSGIHYHIDFTDCYDLLNQDIIDKSKDEMLLELDKWQYRGKYNARGVSPFCSIGHQWIRFQSTFKTMEIRIGEMTFDYQLLFNRVTHANKIANILKNKLNNIVVNYNNDSSEIVNNRIIKI